MRSVGWVYHLCYWKEFIIACYSFAGVIWKGDSLIDGVPETLDMLRTKVCLCNLNTCLHKY